MTKLLRKVFSSAVLLAGIYASSADAAQLLTPAQMHRDLTYLRTKILSQDSNPWLYTKQSDFERLYATTYGDVDKPMDRVAFYRHAARLAASLRDGHTLVDPLIDDFQAYAKTGGVLPVEVSFIDGRLYVASNASGNENLKPGAEITAINGRSVAAIVTDYRGLINDVHPIYDVYARLFRELYWLSYGGPATFDIAWNDGKSKGVVKVASHVYPEDAFHSYLPGGQRYSFQMKTGEIGILTINSFTPSDGFSSFLDESFTTLATTHAKALIIDVRKNGGGSGRLAEETVSYLTDKPYKQIGAFYVKVTDDLKDLYARGDTHTDADTKRLVMENPSGSLVDGLKGNEPLMATPAHRDHVFHGPVYLLTANNTFSAAAMFTAYVKCNGLGQVVGEAPGQATNFVADAVPFTMPASGLTFDVSFSEIHMPCEQSYTAGIAPDYPVKPSPEGLKTGQDEVLDYAVQLATRRQ